MMPRWLRHTLLLVLTCSLAGQGKADDRVSFGRDVLPVLSDRCFRCHGPDESSREADLRLDVRESAIADRGGYAAVTPMNADASELLVRISTGDPDLIMPPPDSHRKPLSQRETESIRLWIEQGAEWGRHWSFDIPQRPDVPDAARHPVDAFIRQRLETESLKPSQVAPRHTLFRRLSFDLTGLPPTARQVEKFVADGQGR
jgi:Planctomycete cytochrome C/Protein of unknown function (DUF1549)